MDTIVSVLQNEGLDFENFGITAVNRCDLSEAGLQSGRAGRARVGPGVIRVEPGLDST